MFLSCTDCVSDLCYSYLCLPASCVCVAGLCVPCLCVLTVSLFYSDLTRSKGFAVGRWGPNCFHANALQAELCLFVFWAFHLYATEYVDGRESAICVCNNYSSINITENVVVAGWLVINNIYISKYLDIYICWTAFCVTIIVGAAWWAEKQDKYAWTVGNQ